MKTPLMIMAAAAAALSAPAMAQDYTTAEEPRIVERDAKGKATKVLIDEVVYPVCTSADQDHCINPRAAGLAWGDVPLGYWPGEPASAG